MKFLSGRRLVSACIVGAALAAAAITPAVASATPSRSDLLKQCEGTNTDGHGSTFQAPLLVKMTESFSTSSNEWACSGSQGSKGTPAVTYLHTGSDAGSGACLHGWGAEVAETEKTDFGTIGFCGTDEAPNEKQHGEIEKRRKGGENNDLMTFPVAQGAVAIVIHLPTNCVAESETEKAGKFTKLGRLVLDDSTIAGIYQGTIKTWKAAIENEFENATVGKDKLSCKGGAEGISYEEGGEVKTLGAGEKATSLQEEEQLITPVVRLDKSGTTHIFKSFLEQVNPTGAILMEEYPETLPSGRGKSGCEKGFSEEDETWSQVAEGCQNQRWPVAAKVAFGSEKGNQGVLKVVNTTVSSIGYADLAVARDETGFGQFDKTCKSPEKAPECGGENKKGSATKVGEQNHKFWAEVQDTATPSAEGYADPASNGDVEAAAQSNCKNTVYSNEAGKKFPPQNVREEWNEAKAELVQKATYAICGITYDLGLRQYKYYPETTKEEATTVHDFLWFVVNTKAGGGQSVITKSDYEKLPSSILEEDEDGLEEMSWENPGVAK